MPVSDHEPSASAAPDKPAPKKAVKIAQKHAPGRDNAAMDTAAAPPPQPAPFGGLFGFLRQSPRYANGPGLSFWQ